MPMTFLTTPFESWSRFGRPTAMAAWATDDSGNTKGEYFLLVGTRPVQHGVIDGSAGGGSLLRVIMGKLNGEWLRQHSMDSGVPVLYEFDPREIYVEEPGVVSVVQAVQEVASKNPALGQALAQYR